MLFIGTVTGENTAPSFYVYDKYQFDSSKAKKHQK